jgi:hypothetical protein
MQGWRRPMALNGTGIEFGKSEHVFTCGISRATTVSADFKVLGQRCGVQVFPRKVYRVKRPYPVESSRGARPRYMPRQLASAVAQRTVSRVLSCQAQRGRASLSRVRPSARRRDPRPLAHRYAVSELIPIFARVRTTVQKHSSTQTVLIRQPLCGHGSPPF